MASDAAAFLCSILDKLFFSPLLAICFNLVPRWDTQEQPGATQRDLVKHNTPDPPSTLGNRCVLAAMLCSPFGTYHEAHLKAAALRELMSMPCGCW